MEVFNRALVVNNAFYEFQLRVLSRCWCTLFQSAFFCTSLEAQTDVNYWNFWKKKQIFFFKCLLNVMERKISRRKASWPWMLKIIFFFRERLNSFKIGFNLREWVSKFNWMSFKWVSKFNCSEIKGSLSCGGFARLGFYSTCALRSCSRHYNSSIAYWKLKH